MFKLTTVEIGIVIASIAVALVVALIVLNATVFSNMRLKKSVRELNRRFEYLHALLFGQDAQFVKRLEIISRTNLLYVDIHMSFNKRFKTIKDSSDSTAQASINTAKDLVTDRKWKLLKQSLNEVRKHIEEFEAEVNLLNADLLKVVKPEEDCRQAALSRKEELRKIKQDYFIKQADLSLVANTFDTAFENLESCFARFEGFVESANYEEANELLEKVSGVINQLAKIFPSLPNLCTLIMTVIPEKLTSLRNRYEDLVRKGYPLNHLMVKISLEDMNNELAACREKVIAFDIANVGERLDAILRRIQSFFEAFDKEEQAKSIFEAECAETYALDSQIDKRYIKLCNSLQDVKRIFVISDAQQENISRIRDEINKTGATKRSLDTFIHSGTPQPYTALVQKMHLLRDEANSCTAILDDFDTYLLSLKSDCENGLKVLEECYGSLRKSDNELNAIDLNCVEDKYKQPLSEAYDLIDLLYKTLNKMPIDVQKVNNLVNDLTAKTKGVTTAVSLDTMNMQKADAIIVYANRDRNGIGNLAVQLQQFENMYFNGQFSDAAEQTVSALKVIKNGER